MGAVSILVIGSDTRAFLGVIRSFARRGATVDVVPLDDFDPSLQSRYIRRIHTIGFPQGRHAQWIDELANLIATYRYDLVVPVDDRSILPIDENRDRFEGQTTLAMPGAAQIRAVNSKSTMRELARAHAVPLSDGRVADGPDSIRAAADELGFPVVLKPISSYSIEALANRRAVRKAFTRRELESLLASEFASGSAVVERNFVGVGVGVTVLCKDGDVLAALQHERLHEPLHGGGASYRVSLPVAPDLLSATRRLMGAVSYTGVAMIEFKRNHTSGDAIFIEVNGRFAGSLPLCLASNFDLPWWYGEMLLDGRREFPTDFRVGRYGRAISADLYWLVGNLRADKSDPALATVPILRTILEPLRLFTGRETLDALSRDDPRPGVEELRQHVGTRFFNWQYRRPRATRPQLARGARVLVVCKGNICRSPFAAKVLEAHRPDLQVDSAGYYPVSGRCAPEEGVIAAGRLGVDLSRHRSKTLCRALLESHDVILVFDRENVVTLRLHFPDIMPRVSTFASAYIEDPWGGTIDRFDACYREIESAAAVFDAKRT